LLLSIALVLAFVLLPLRIANAQQPARLPHVGIIPGIDRANGRPYLEAFEQGLRELGYVEGQNILLEYRWVEPGQSAGSDGLAVALVRRGVDVIVVGTGRAALAAKKATDRIPIVIAVAPDPVGEGLVPNLARPGGNITGLSYLSGDLAPKQLELLKAGVPGASRVAVVWTGAIPAHALLLREMKAAARTLGVTIQAIEVRAPGELDGAFAAMKREHADGLLVLPNTVWIMQQARLDALAARHRLPVMYSAVSQAESGGLMAYAADARDNWRRAATYVHKVLNGARPGDLPIEQPRKFELVLNLRTARELGLTIPQSLRLRADRVIE
jgi:putative ABC transport system substrate-binding protein